MKALIFVLCFFVMMRLNDLGIKKRSKGERKVGYEEIIKNDGTGKG